MYSKILSLCFFLSVVHLGFAQETNKYNPWKEPKKYKKEEARLQKAREAAKASMKVWELPSSRDYKIYESDGFSAQFLPNTSRRQTKEFIAIVGNRTGQYPTAEDIFIEYRGACGQQLLVKSNALMYTHPLLQNYIQTRNIKDFPIQGMLNALVKGLKDQCDNLEAVRFTSGPIGLSAKQGEMEHEVITIQGHMTKANGWRLEKGFGDALASYTVKLHTGYFPISKFAVNYEGTCHTSQKLDIAPVFTNNTERYGYKKVKGLFYYEEVAKKAIEQYILECSNVEEFEFTLNYLPEDMFVKEGKAGVITASKSDNWELDTSQFGYIRSLGPRINDYEDVITQLETGDFPLFEQYTDFFKLFYEDFMDAYGTVCRSQLKNPTTIKIHAFETRYNDLGYKISETSLGPPQVLYIETAYLKRYQSIAHYNKGTVLYNIFKGFFSGDQRAGVDAILFRLRGSEYIKKHINSNCNGEDLKVLYNYIQELAKRIE
ncbi:hypothetical protein [Formosa algae]|uniref:Uncharacterized protein n=1 Tax=Formosa algae TaxID=225843 RepID=A0A9X0YPV4_9FLAO|nr:hypothetical protein [Formosa algae]MBP1840996.1 hypothetical protein [Formosa algae]MDQ0336107.1 hypothetical protein [Formosa algae]OEI79895.1 hypothetical protein AST99_11435 [Formosa algae]